MMLKSGDIHFLDSQRQIVVSNVYCRIVGTLNSSFNACSSYMAVSTGSQQKQPRKDTFPPLKYIRVF